jgi:ubiquinone biosynthesis protein UbiJ
LRAHAGKVARIDAGVVNLKWKVAADGMLQAAMADDAENVVVRVQPADLPRILQDRSRAVSYVKVEGDADFAWSNCATMWNAWKSAYKKYR